MYYSSCDIYTSRFSAVLNNTDVLFVLLQVRRQLHSVLEKIKETVEKQPPRRSFQLALPQLPQLPYTCDVNGFKDALKSHPLDISVWG